MDAIRLAVTVLGAALILAVNLYFLSGPRSRRPGR